MYVFSLFLPLVEIWLRKIPNFWGSLVWWKWICGKLVAKACLDTQGTDPRERIDWIINLGGLVQRRVRRLVGLERATGRGDTAWGGLDGVAWRGARGYPRWRGACHGWGCSRGGGWGGWRGCRYTDAPWGYLRPSSSRRTWWRDWHGTDATWWRRRGSRRSLWRNRWRRWRPNSIPRNPRTPARPKMVAKMRVVTMTPERTSCTVSMTTVPMATTTIHHMTIHIMCRRQWLAAGNAYCIGMVTQV